MWPGLNASSRVGSGFVITTPAAWRLCGISKKGYSVESILSVEFFVGVIVYELIGIIVGKWYWQRRHGLRKKIFLQGSAAAWDVVFSSILMFIFIWPILLFFPKIRNPELCSCPGHVEKRAQMRQDYANYQQALADERRDRM